MDVWEARRDLFRVDFVAPNDYFKNNLAKLFPDAQLEVIDADLQGTIERERERLKLKQGGEFGWDDYHNLEEIYAHVRDLEATYPDIASVEVLGQSFEGREVLALKICHDGECGNKPAIFIQASKQ